MSVLFSVCQLDQFLVKKCLSKFFSPSFTDIQQKVVCSFSKNLSVNSTKLHSTSLEEKFEDKTLIWQRCCLFFSCSSKFERRNNGLFLSKKQSANLSHLLTTYPRRFFEQFFFEKFLFFIIGHWATFVSHFDENLSVPMSVLLSVCHLDQFVVKRFCLIFFLHQLQTLIANWSVFVRIFFGQVDDTAFYESKVSIWRRKNVLPNLCLFHLSFADLEQKNQGFFRKTIGSVVKMAYHVSKEIFCRELFFEKVLFLFQHWALSELFLSIRRKFVGPVVSTVFCLSNGPVCGENIIVQKFFSQHFWTLIAKWSIFVRFFFGQVDDTAFYGCKGSIWGTKAVLKNSCLFYLSFADLEPKNQGFFSENN